MSDKATPVDGWVSQADAVTLLAGTGDKISQQALSAYLKKHTEVATRSEGRRIYVHWPSLRTSRATRNARGPASQGALFEAPTTMEPAAPQEAAQPSIRAQVYDTFGHRRAQADTDRAEADARRAKVLADEAEGRVISRDTAINAFTTAGIALVRAMEEARMGVVDAVRAAPDARGAVMAMQNHEKAVRTAFANALSEYAAASEPVLAAAE